MTKREQIGKYLVVLSTVLVLLTTYLAIFYAPLPYTSVRSAGELMPSLEGDDLSVAGFVWAVYEYNSWGLDASVEIVFSLADFSDYERYIEANASGALDDQWWTVRPIDVRFLGGGMLVGYPDPFAEGDNVSVVALVQAEGIGPHSNVTGFSLFLGDPDGLVIRTTASQFSIMTAPIAQKIFYFHMPAAWVGYVAFFTTLVSSILYLKTRDLKFDRWAHAAAELGVLFATIAILTGPVWAKQEWGVYWRWEDTKLTTTFVLWLVYIGYLMLRASMQEAGARARVAAVYGIAGFVTVPMSLLSSRIAPLLRSSHPQVIATSSGGLSPEAGLTVGVAVVAFTVLFITMLIKRVEIAESEEELEELKRDVGGEA